MGTISMIDIFFVGRHISAFDTRFHLRVTSPNSPDRKYISFCSFQSYPSTIDRNPPAVITTNNLRSHFNSLFLFSFSFSTFSYIPSFHFKCTKRLLPIKRPQRSSNELDKFIRSLLNKNDDAYKYNLLLYENKKQNKKKCNEIKYIEEKQKKKMEKME